MAVAGCPDYFLHHPSYQVRPNCYFFVGFFFFFGSFVFLHRLSTQFFIFGVSNLQEPEYARKMYVCLILYQNSLKSHILETAFDATVMKY